MTDRVVLDYWNGRPTEWISVEDGKPILHWLIMGHVEPFDVWVRIKLTWDQADYLCRTAGPLNLEEFVSGLAGAPTQIDFRAGGISLVTLEGKVPQGDAPVAYFLRALDSGLTQLAEGDGPDAQVAFVANEQIRELVSC